MRIDNPIISGSLIVSGSTTITGVLSASSFTGDGSGLTGVTSYTDTDTLNFINSINVLSGSIDWNTLEGKPSGIVSSSSQVSFTTISDKPTLVSGSSQINFASISNKPTLVSGSSQIIYNQISNIPSGIISSSNQLSNQTIPGNLTITGKLTAEEFHTEFVSASIIYKSGSTKFGDSADDVHSFTGSLNLLGTLSATTIQNVVSSSSQISFTGITDKPTLVSGSAQISSLGFTTCVGDITGVTAGTGLSGGGTSGDVTLAVDLSELTDMTATMVGTDEFIVLDAGEDRRKAANEIGLSIFNNDSSFTSCTGTVTSVGGTGTVNGITLTGTVTSTGNLTLGGTLGSITVSQLDGAAVQTSAEAFSDSDTVLMTAAAIEDRITGKGYTTCTGTVTSVATNNGLTGGTITSTGTIGLTGQALALHNLATNGVIARTGAGTVAGRTITGGTNITVTNGDGVSGNPTISTSATTCTGTVTSVATGTGLTGGTITSTGTISLSHLGFQNLTDPNADRVAFWDDSAGAFAWLAMGSNLSITGTTLNATDTNTTYTATNMLDCIKTVDGASSGLDADLLDGNHASAFYLASNPSGYTTCTGTVTSVTAGTYLTGGTITTTGTIAVDATTTATAGKIVARDANGDDYRRYGFAQYFNMSHSTSTRSSDTIFYSSTDTYLRKNDSTGMRASLNVPTRTGGDASGTWGINITGNAATATNADTLDGYHGSNYIGLNGNSYYQLTTWLQSTGAHGFYSPNSGAGTHFYPGSLGDYGSFRVDGRKGGWSGYSIEGRTLFMHNGSTAAGLYNDVNNQWMFYAVFNSSTYMGYAGTYNRFYTTSGGATLEGTFSATGDVIAYSSDKRLKKNIKSLGDASQIISKINVYNFDWDEEKSVQAGFTPTKDNEDGFIAQELKEIYPNAVDYAPFDRDEQGESKSGEDYLTVKPDKLIPLLIQSNKELQKRIEKLEQKLLDNGTTN